MTYELRSQTLGGASTFRISLLRKIACAMSGLFLIADCAKGEVVPQENAALGQFFEQQGVKGTFVLLDVKTGAIQVHNAERAAKRFVPASTFKIPNSLIALETGAVKSVDEVVPYGGKPQPLPQWEHDMPLREAIKLSAVPIYQEVARRAGIERMREWLTRMKYGNQQTGAAVDQFWLVGPLEISAIEQAQFLARLVKGEFQRRPEYMKAVSEISELEKAGAYTLHGKTGWATVVDPDIGWWVGWIERDGELTTTFALNIAMPSKDDVAKRVPLGRACLMELGAWPKPDSAP
jgi:beta-lactamase class D